MNKVSVYDSGSAFCITVNGMITSAHNSLGGAWKHIAWMYRVATQDFIVKTGKTEMHSKEWLDMMIKQGYLEKKAGFDYV